jgi:hypothetical protein
VILILRRKRCLFRKKYAKIRFSHLWTLFSWTCGAYMQRTESGLLAGLGSPVLSRLSLCSEDVNTWHILRSGKLSWTARVVVWRKLDL